ncbi:MAG: hypothetical protein KAS51_06205 [Candidatus Omnitrophica bacterium]|nr:hypothetical protein [Candidatus Omnitrophota bacterium]
MHLEVFSLCDAATTDTGKLNILGAFDTIWCSKIPAVHPQCSIALRIRFDAIEKGEHKISVNFVDADGKHILPPTNGIIKINFQNDQRSGSSHLIFNIQGLKLEKYAEYSIDLAIDGRSEASLPLFVKQQINRVQIKRVSLLNVETILKNLENVDLILS